MSKRLLLRIEVVFKKCRLGTKNTARIVIENWDWQVLDEEVEIRIRHSGLIEASVQLASMLPVASCEIPA